MNKKEIIWREILHQAIENKKRTFQQRDLAEKFGFSLSTVFNALKVPRAAGAIVRKRKNFVLENPEKLLYIWATFRNLKKEIIYETGVKKSAREIESLLPADTIFGAYSAFVGIFKEAPADYDKVYVYADEEAVKEIKRRFPENKKSPNLIALKADKFLKDYGELTSIAQTFVDIWNLPEWYAEDFYKEFQRKLSELL